MDPTSAIRPDNGDNDSNKSFFQFDAILGLRLASIGLLLASTILHFNGDQATAMLNAFVSVVLLSLVWHLAMVLMTARLPRVWQSKKQPDDDDDDAGAANGSPPSAYRLMAPLNDAWLSACLFMITVWTKTSGDIWVNTQYRYNFRVIFVLNMITVVFMYGIAILENVRAYYPSYYVRLVPGSSSRHRISLP